MIDLQKIVYYEFIDDAIIEIFDRYKWGLKNLGVTFTEEVGETMIAYSFNLENSLKAFCAWILWKTQQGENFTADNINAILIESLKSHWIPTEFQEKFLRNYADILENPQNLLWRQAEKILGTELRDRVIANITEKGEIFFRENFTLADDELDKLTLLKLHFSEIFLP